MKKLAKQVLVATLTALYVASGAAAADESEDVRILVTPAHLLMVVMVVAVAVAANKLLIQRH